MGTRRVKIKGSGRDRWRGTFRLRVVKRWKGKRKIIVGSSGEKWEYVNDVTTDVAQQECNNNKCDASTLRYNI